VGVANAYDAMHLVAAAIEKAGSTNGDAIRQGFYKIDAYDGLIKKYTKPFTPQNHDAINENDYVWTQFIDNQIVPVGMKKEPVEPGAARRPPRAAVLLCATLSSAHARPFRPDLRPRPREHVRTARARLLHHLLRVEHRELRAGQLDDARRGVRVHAERP